MSAKMFQEIIAEMKESVDQRIGVIDDSGLVVASSSTEDMGHVFENAVSEIVYAADSVVIDGYTFCPFGTRAHFEYAVYACGTDAAALQTAKLLCISLSHIKQLYDERFDQANFIKNVILDNVFPGDIYYKVKELHLNNELSRIVFLIRAEDKTDVSLYEILLSIFPEKDRDYVINISEGDIVVVREVREGEDRNEIEQVARQLVDTLAGEFFLRCRIGIGTLVDDVKGLANSYKEAQTALNVGRVFDVEKSVVCYDKLGVGRLIYQLPTTLCDIFLQEVFQQGSIELLDSETLLTIQKFFENNLNVSETARRLFVHRNTLVYRLEKIRKLTGLDIREFDNAVVFKVALMVNRYLTANDKFF